MIASAPLGWAMGAVIIFILSRIAYDEWVRHFGSAAREGHRQVAARLRAALVDALDASPHPAGSEPWVRDGVAAMHAAVTVELHRQHRHPVPLEVIAEAEARAAGHAGYPGKFASACARLVMAMP